MLCDICHKNAATVHITELVNDKMMEMHLCEQCAQAKGISLPEDFPLADFLAGLTDFELTKAKKPTLRCSHCGLDYEDFKRIGRLGCPHCYENFKESLTPLLKRIQGGEQHVGKFPHYVDKSTKQALEIKNLQRKLDKAIQEENFEKAAIIRDKIKKIKK